MKKLAEVSAKVAIVVLAAATVFIALYGVYQQSQLYPAINQQLGYQKCVADVNAQIAQQQEQAKQAQQAPVSDNK